MIFLDCPAVVDDPGTATTQCGLPAVVCRVVTVDSTDGPVRSVMIRCPARHWFNAPMESLGFASSALDRLPAVTFADGHQDLPGDGQRDSTGLTAVSCVTQAWQWSP